MDALLFLLKLAWDCRYRLPLLITVGFMVLDVRMQLDINVQTRYVPRQRVRRQEFERPPFNEADINERQLLEWLEASEDSSEASADSWTTLEEEETLGAEDV